MREAAVSMGHLMMNSPTLNATPSVTVRFSSMEIKQGAQTWPCRRSSRLREERGYDGFAYSFPKIRSGMNKTTSGKKISRAATSDTVTRNGKDSRV